MESLKADVLPPFSSPPGIPDNAPDTIPPRRDPTRVHLPEFMPFFWLGWVAIAGTLGADLLRFPWFYWGIGLALSIGWLVVKAIKTPHKSGNRNLPLSVLVGTFCLAALLYSLSLPKNTPNEVQFYNEKGRLELIGVVVSPPVTQQNSIDLTVRAESLTVLESPKVVSDIDGKILLQVPLGSTYQYGDRLSIRGELSTPSEGGSFSYRSYLAHQGIYSLSRYASVKLLAHDQSSPILSAIYRLRDQSTAVLAAILPSPENALLRGILLGDDSAISTELQKAYALTGTAHIIAISGFNMAILAGLVSRLFTKRWGARRGGLLAILVLGIYTVFVGASASVVRAAIMGSYAILGALIARRGNVLNSLGLCVLIMVVINPHIPWDIGFQLSAMATLGLALYASPLQSKLEKWLTLKFGEKTSAILSGSISEYFLITLIAQAMVLPLLLYHFKEISPLFLLANPLVLPIQPLVMVLGLAALIGGLLSLSLGRVLCWLVWPFAAYTNRVVTLLASLWPVSWRLPSFSFFWVGLYYLLFFFLTLRKDQNLVEKRTLNAAFALTSLCSVCLLLWSVVASAPDGKLALRVFQTSSEPVVLVRTSAGRYLLVGGSLPANSLAQQVSNALPTFSRQLDYLLIPSCSRDSVSGLFDLTSQLQIQQVVWACDPERLQTTQRLYETFAQEQIDQMRLSDNQVFDLGNGAQAIPSLSEEKLQSLLIIHEGFKSQINFDPGYSLLPADLSLLIAENLPEVPQYRLAPSSAALMVAQSGLDEVISAGFNYQPLYYSQYTWLEASSDGKHLWIKGFK